MKKFIALVALVMMSAATTAMYAQESRAERRADRKAQRDAERARMKAEEQVADAISYDDAVAALKAHQFVLEADQVMFRNGQTAFVNSNTNFVLVNQGRGTVQVAFNTVYPGPNGIGGVTVDGTTSDMKITTASNPQPIGFSGILLAKRQNSFYCTYFLHNRNVADTKSPYPIKRLEVIRWFNQKSMVFNQSLS